jgi:hypothetical protein
MTAYICGECKQPWPTLRLAADCHPGIGGVEEVPPATGTRDPWGTGPLAARHAMAREIAKMAGDRAAIDGIRQALVLQQRRLTRMPRNTAPAGAISTAYDYITNAVDALQAMIQAFDNA